MKKPFILILFLGIVLYSCQKDNGDEPVTGLLSNQINALYIDANNVVWVGTPAGLSAFHQEEWTNYTVDNEPGMAGNQINEIDFQQSSYGPEIWLATDQGASVFAIDVDAVTSATSYLSGDGLGGNTVATLSVDADNVRWFGTENGLSTFAGQNWDFTELARGNPRINHMGSGPDSISFVGTELGVFLYNYDREVDAITAQTIYEIPWSAIPSNNILSVFVDEAGTQWFGTDAGIAVHGSIEAKEDWNVYTRSTTGLVSDTVISILKDDTGDLWFGTPRGLSRYSQDVWITYNAADGLAHDRVNVIAQDSDGVMWFGTNDGLSLFDGSNWTTYRKP